MQQLDTPSFLIQLTLDSLCLRSVGAAAACRHGALQLPDIVLRRSNAALKIRPSLVMSSQQFEFGPVGGEQHRIRMRLPALRLAPALLLAGSGEGAVLLPDPDS